MTANNNLRGDGINTASGGCLFRIYLAYTMARPPQGKALNNEGIVCIVIDKTLKWMRVV